MRRAEFRGASTGTVLAPEVTMMELGYREVAFQRGRCLIEIQPGPATLPADRYQARLWLLDPDTTTLRPLVFADGSPVEVHGDSKALVVNRAVVLLEQHFGAIAEPDFGRHIPSPVVGAPVILPV
jgi:hypothetical protein